MYALYCYYTFTITCLVIITRIWFLIYCQYKNKQRKHIRTSPAKTMIILGSGGHTAEMLRILKHLNFKNYSPRIYIHACTDKISMEKAKDFETNNTDYKIIKISRSREVQQSYLTSIYTTISATLDSIPLVWSERPDLILCNGPGTCVPLCIIMSKNYSVTQLSSIISWKLLLEDLQNYVPIEIKIHLTVITIILKDLHESETNPSKEWIENSLIIVEACLDKTWELLNSGYWKDVPVEYRYAYSLCSVIKAVLLEIRYSSHIEESVNKGATVSEEIIKQIDKGILLGGPLPSLPSLLTDIADKINISQTIAPLETTSKGLVINCKDVCETILPGFSEVTYYNKPSMELFYKKIFLPKNPAILKGCMEHWKALNRWQNLNYLSKVAGSRTVPIEIGSRYTETDWTQHLINFSEFLQKHISTKNDKVGYLAQHQLFEQIPELKGDFAIPEYCSFTDLEEVEQPDVNAWFGPAGTVSPLHFDPKNNLLCQVFGYKRVILYHPDDTINLYPYDTRLLNNTAQVDPMNPDYEMWPNFVKAKGIMCYLKPGEMLYLPPKWWHHVTALTQSFSVSFWWD